MTRVKTELTFDRIMMNLSVITAGLPSLHRFLSDLQTGLMGTQILEQHELSTSRQDYKFSNKSGRSATYPVGIGSKSGAMISNKIFSDTNTRKRGGDGEDSTSSLTNDGGVTQTWEFSQEVEDDQIRHRERF